MDLGAAVVIDDAAEVRRGPLAASEGRGWGQDRPGVARFPRAGGTCRPGGPVAICTVVPTVAHGGVSDRLIDRLVLVIGASGPLLALSELRLILLANSRHVYPAGAS